jgi:membrane-anchored glycerophosphoryl diester phosphodiesterase (GDPDase)
MGNVTDGDVVGHFRLAYQAVARYPVLIVPPLVVAVVPLALIFFVVGGAAALMGAVMGGAVGGGTGAVVGGIVVGVLVALVLALVMGILWLLSSGMVVVMARDALAGREPALGDALSAVLARLAAVVAASALVGLVVWIGFLFLVIPGIVAAVCLMFTLPAVLLDGLGAVDGMRRSVALVRANVGAVVGLVVGVILVMIGLAIVGALLGLIPIVGGLAWFVLSSAAVSYLTVVGVRYYGILRAA